MIASLEVALSKLCYFMSHLKGQVAASWQNISLLEADFLFCKGVFLVSAKNAFVPLERNHSVNTYSRISTVPRGSERSE